MPKFKPFSVISYIIGLLIVAFGITLIIRADLGTGPWDALVVGLSRLTDLTVGNWIIIVGIFLLVINACLLQERPDLPALLTVFILGNFVDFWLTWFESSFSLFLAQFIILLLGLIFIALGVAVYTRTRFAITPIDQLMFVISKRTGYSLQIARLISEGIALLLAFLFHGPIGVGTIIVAVFLGPLIQFFISIVQSNPKNA